MFIVQCNASVFNASVFISRLCLHTAPPIEITKIARPLSPVEHWSTSTQQLDPRWSRHAEVSQQCDVTANLRQKMVPQGLDNNVLVPQGHQPKKNRSTNDGIGVGGVDIYLAEETLLGFQFLDELIDALDDDAGLALWWVTNLCDGVTRSEVNIETVDGAGIDLLLLGFHDVGEGGVAWLSEAQVNGSYGRDLGLDRLQTTINFAGGSEGVTVDLQAGKEGRLRPVEESSEHLSSLVGIVINGLLANDHEVGGLLFHEFSQNFGDTERLQVHVGAQVGLDVDTTVASHGEGCADGLLALLRADGSNNDFVSNLGLLQADRLLYGDFAEGIHGHFDIGELDS